MAITLAVNNVIEDGQGPFVAIDFYTDNIDPAVIFAEITGRHANGSDVMTERVYWWMTHSPWGNRLAKFRQWVEPAGEWTFVPHETARDGTRLGPDSEPVVVNVGPVPLGAVKPSGLRGREGDADQLLDRAQGLSFVQSCVFHLNEVAPYQWEIVVERANGFPGGR